MNEVRYAALLACISLALPCLRGETIYLTTGFSLEAQSHAFQGDSIIIQMDTGTLEFSRSQVARIEAHAAERPPAPTAGSNPLELLKTAATGQGLEPELVESVARIESGLRPDAVSKKGAIGLMQLMPPTAAELNARPHDAASNALGGAKYLRELLLRYRGDYVLALAAYNAGPGAVAKYHGIPPYAETVRYVMNVLREYKSERAKAISDQPSAISKLKADR